MNVTEWMRQFEFSMWSALDRHNYLPMFDPRLTLNGVGRSG